MFGLFRRKAPQPAASAARVPEALWARIEQSLPFLDFLPAPDRPRLRALAIEFLEQKEFHGANGLPLTNEIMLSIALQACVPILNIGLDAYSGWVGIVVYPGEILIRRRETDEHGVVHEFDDTVLGEAWPDGPVVISWDVTDTATTAEGEPESAAEPVQPADSTASSATPYRIDYPSQAEAEPPAPNVVLHEFAHKLDMINGGADGFPVLHADMSRSDWASAFSAAYDDFCERVDHVFNDHAFNEHALPMDPYGAEHPAEFFAVASETFFEAPSVLLHAYPEVYRQLAQFYRQDPAAGERALYGEPDSDRHV